jgi:CubicO group peptidase (beta-lactamase class C family)
VTRPNSRGHCDDRFDAVGAAFEANFTERGEVGAALCIWWDDEVVVDLVGGTRDLARSQPWEHDTLVDVYSVGKPVVALLALQLVDAGVVTLDAPVASIWHDFGAQGKETVTVRHALSHLAGVPAIEEPLSNDDLASFTRMCDALAFTRPWASAGERLIYHTNTYGHLVGGLVMAATGRTPGEQLASMMVPLEGSFYFGVPPSDRSRCADVHWDLEVVPNPSDLALLTGDQAMVAQSYFNPPGYSSIGIVNTSSWRAAQVPSTNGHADARGVASLYHALLEPDRIISRPLRDEASAPQSSGHCPVLGEEAVFGLGFTPTSPRRSFGPSATSFGHFGTGGAVGFCDPEHRIAMGYVMNHVIPRWQSSRNRALIDALASSLANLSRT